MELAVDPAGVGEGRSPGTLMGHDILGRGLTCWDAMPAPTNWFLSSQITKDGTVKKKGLSIQT